MLKKPISILLVSPDEQLRNWIKGTLAGEDRFQMTTCASEREALTHLKAKPQQILYADVTTNTATAVSLIETVVKTYPAIYVAAGSNSGTARDVVAAMQAGAADFIVDPFDREMVRATFHKAARDLSLRKDAGTDRFDRTRSFITQDQALLRVLDIARKVAPSEANVLITGESGTGKELLARFIHANSQRGNEPYMAVNCAALPDQLADSELFGHEKGAFTGAISRKIGKFESAGEGTLVLDEITEMTLPLQAKLLRALQEREIVRVGSNRAIPVDARVIAISNQVMKKAVSSGVFREDLYYRLNVIPLTIPPLRERKNDIPILAEAFLKRYSEKNKSAMVRISKAALALLMSQNWAGNVRELQNTIERGVLIGSGDSLLPEHLILGDTLAEQAKPSSPVTGMTVREMEKQLITNTLEAVNDNRTHAAKMLGISIRTLRNKLNEYREEIEKNG